jgi:hypothetical protein
VKNWAEKRRENGRNSEKIHLMGKSTAGISGKSATAETLQNRAAEIPSRAKRAKNAGPKFRPNFLAAEEGFGTRTARLGGGRVSRPAGRARRLRREKIGAKKSAQKIRRKKTPKMAEFPEKYI